MFWGRGKGYRERKERGNVLGGEGKVVEEKGKCSWRKENGLEERGNAVGGEG